MKLVIDIPEKIYELCQRDVCRWPIRNGRTLYRTVWEAIANGKPLPKGHGDLKDVDAIHEEIHKLQSGIAKNGGTVIVNKDQYKGLCYARGIINEAPVIIEADKEE